MRRFLVFNEAYMTERSDKTSAGFTDDRSTTQSGGEGTTHTSWQTLAHLPTGQRCRIHAVGGSGIMRRRLMDLGIFPDAEITLLRVAPLNDPIEIRVGNSFVSLRRSEADLIEVVAL